MLHNFKEIAICHFQQSACTYFSVECNMSYMIMTEGELNIIILWTPHMILYRNRAILICHLVIERDSDRLAQCVLCRLISLAYQLSRGSLHLSLTRGLTHSATTKCLTEQDGNSCWMTRLQTCICCTSTAASCKWQALNEPNSTDCAVLVGVWSVILYLLGLLLHSGTVNSKGNSKEVMSDNGGPAAEGENKKAQFAILEVW